MTPRHSTAVYPVGVPLVLYVWLRSFRHRLDPAGPSPDDCKEARLHDTVLHDAPITKLAIHFEPRWWWCVAIHSESTPFLDARHPRLSPPTGSSAFC